MDRHAVTVGQAVDTSASVLLFDTMRYSEVAKYDNGGW